MTREHPATNASPGVLRGLAVAEIAAVTVMAWIGGFLGVFLAGVFIWGVVTAAISGPDTGSRLAAIWRNRVNDWGLWRKPTWRDWASAAAGFAVLYLVGEVYGASNSLWVLSILLS